MFKRGPKEIYFNFWSKFLKCFSNRSHRLTFTSKITSDDNFRTAFYKIFNRGKSALESKNVGDASIGSSGKI